MSRLSNRQWRILLGAVSAGCAFLLIQDPPLPQPWPMVLGLIVVIATYIKAPTDVDAE